MGAMKRTQMLQDLDKTSQWDVLIIGGGATGLGIAVDAASRGFKTLLLEQSDFAKGTSSRSTKLIHGGLRYLQQGNLSLVAEALKERGLLCKNAPQLVHPLPFLVPNYKWWEGPFYGIGIKLYDLLAGKLGLESSHFLSKKETIQAVPTIETRDLRGAIVYYDGQFDDARLAISLAHTAAELGATLLNYVEVVDFLKKGGIITGVVAKDRLNGQKFSLKARVVVNATGVFSDALRKLDDGKASKIIAPSQGIHLVLPKKFMPSKTALLIPHTYDGRVLFFVPWHEHVLLGTTDTPKKTIDLEPLPLEEEIDFLLTYAKQYLSIVPRRSDILSVFAGLRPLVKMGSSKKTAALSRDHAVIISHSGLLTICGGKWTTYRRMAEDAVNKAILIGGLPDRACVTPTMKLWGYKQKVKQDDPLAAYGDHLHALSKKFHKPLHERLPYIESQIHFAIREEMAETIEDVLSRRTRSLLLDADAAIECAPFVAKILAKERKHSKAWEAKELASFKALAKHYKP
jgi:glycerol-3-phosphate dehydrogenase